MAPLGLSVAGPAFDPATGDWRPAPGPQALPPDAPKPLERSWPWHVLLWVGIAALGLAFLANLYAGAVLLFAPGSEAAERLRDAMASGGKAEQWATVAFTFALFAVIPFVWVLGTRVRPWAGTVRYLGLHQPGPSILKGLLLALPLVAGVIAVSALYILATEGPDGLDALLSEDGGEENPAVDSLLRSLDPFLLVAVPIAAGVGEEVFFRGLLQKRIGVWGQAALFGLFHATGGYVPQVVVACGIGVLFGLLVKRGASLWVVIAAHAGYDFALLSMAYFAA